MTDLVVHPLAKPLVGSVPVPPDRSIGMRALLLASLCEGASELRNFAESEESLAIGKAMRAMGASIDDAQKGVLRVTGTGLMGLQAARVALECGPSSMQLLTGILAGQRFASKLVADARNALPSMHVVGPLRTRGAAIDGSPHPTVPDALVTPLFVGPLADGKELGPLEYTSPVASPDVKDALLLSGLYAHGTTWLKEPALSRDHTEIMLHALGVPLRTLGTMIELEPAGWSGKLAAFDLDIPGDVSAAAYVLVAAQLHEGSRVTVRSVGINPTRTGLFEIARHMGAGLDVVPRGEHGAEPVGEVTAWHQGLRGTSIGGELVPRAIEELPIACALAARALGTTTLRDVDDAALLEAIANMLRAYGITFQQLPGGLAIEGKSGPLDAARVDSGGDPRVAMAAAVLALGGRGPSTIADCASIGSSFPRFVGTLRALGARIDVS